VICQIVEAQVVPLDDFEPLLMFCHRFTCMRSVQSFAKHTYCTLSLADIATGGWVVSTILSTNLKVGYSGSVRNRIVWTMKSRFKYSDFFSAKLPLNLYPLGV